MIMYIYFDPSKTIWNHVIHIMKQQIHDETKYTRHYCHSYEYSWTEYTNIKISPLSITRLIQNDLIPNYNINTFKLTWEVRKQLLNSNKTEQMQSIPITLLWNRMAKIYHINTDQE